MMLRGVALLTALSVAVVAVPRATDLLDGCQTRSPTECEKTIMWLVDREFEALNSDGRRHLKDKKTKIHFYLHVLAPEKKKGGELPGKLRKNLLKALKKGFQDTPFTFVYKGMTVSKNDVWHECNDEEGYKNELRVGGKDTLNVYLCDTRKKVKQITATFSVPTPLMGIATFPHETENFNGGIVNDGVLLRNPDKRYLKDIQIGTRTYIPASTATEVYETFIHEVGHWMGCLHTFEGGCSPFMTISGVAAGAIGDGVTDTAAEDGPAWNKNGWDTCFKEAGMIPDSCPNDMKNVDIGQDPIRNYMNYVEPKCTKKQGEFSKKQIERMEAQFYTYRSGKQKKSRRRLQDKPLVATLRGNSSVAARRRLDEDEPFIPDADLITACISSAVTECNCELECYYKFRDLLRDWLPFHKFTTIKDDIFKTCSECPKVGSQRGCESSEYCDYGNATVLGNRCAEQKPQSAEPGNDNRCYTPKQCQSGICGASGRCSGCPAQDSEDGCPSGQFCDLADKDFVGLADVNFECVDKKQLGDPCHTDVACESGLSCTGGVCSACPTVGSEEGCPGDEACYLFRKRDKKFYKCRSEATLGLPCASDRDCEGGASCVDDLCRECPTAGKSDGCDEQTQFCDANFKCQNKIENVNLFGTPEKCWSNDMCQSGHCVGSFCRPCDSLGRRGSCGSSEVCIDYKCERKKGESEVCFVDGECRSKDCRSGRCYGECREDADCGVGGSCTAQFCSINGDRDLMKQRYFNTYDCRLGTSFQRCRECAVSKKGATANWQCEEEQYCSSEGQCLAKKPKGTCDESIECTSGKCTRGRCQKGPKCNRNADCISADENDYLYCGSYECREKQGLGKFCTEHHVCESGSCNVVSQKCEECLDDTFCGEAEYCFFGRCLPKLCSTNSGCKEGQKCKFQGEFNQWSCVSCLFDRQCKESGLEVCDPDSNSCVGCLRNDQCDEATHYCSDKACIKKECNTDSDCGGDMPKCDAGRSWKCLPCLADSDCPSERPICDMNSNRCEVCTEDRGCDIQSETCITQLETNFCQGYECEADKDCPGDFVCNQFRECKPCYNDDHCQENEFCLFDFCRPKLCNTNADCASSTIGAVCDTKFFWTCVECAANSHCEANPAKPVCLTELTDDFIPPGMCLECTANEDCNFDEYCLVSNGTCEKRECSSHSDCDGDRICSFNNEQNEAGDKKFSCVDCVSDVQCIKNGKDKCQNNACVQCVQDFHCSGNKQCDRQRGKCVKPECLVDSDCEGQEVCIYKDGELNQCRDCRSDGDCPNSKYCDWQLTNSCLRKQCADDSDCSSGQVCSLDKYVPLPDGGSRRFQCVDCRDSSNCDAAQPICLGGEDESPHVCVACLTGFDCPGFDEDCDPHLFQCMVDECFSDNDCVDAAKPVCAKATDFPHALYKNRCVACLDSDMHCPNSGEICEVDEHPFFVCREDN